MMYRGGVCAAVGRIKARGWRDVEILEMIWFYSKKGEAITQHDSDILWFKGIGGPGDWPDHPITRPAVPTLPRVHVARSPWASRCAVEWAESGRVFVT